MLFDISIQLKVNIKLYNMQQNLKQEEFVLDEFENLAMIFNQKLNIVEQDKNPIREMLKEENILQILPLKESMFEHRYFRFTSLDTDLLSFDINKYNQILIPIIENKKNKEKDDI
jgi:hypothetical protein